MADTVETLILDLLVWLERRERTYEETLHAWRRSGPRLAVWEDANDRGLLAFEPANGLVGVCVTSSGRALLEQRTPSQGQASF